MKSIIAKLLGLGMLCIFLQGCVAFPPLIQVQHKESNSDLKSRLDSLDRRLERLEQKLDEK